MWSIASRSEHALLVSAALTLSAGMAWAGGPLDTVEGYLSAWNAHDSAAAAAYLAEDVRYYDASVGTPVEGREAAKAQVIDAFLNAAPDAVWKIEGAPIVEGNSVAFEWTFSGTNTGAWSDGTEATGKAFSFHGASVFRVDGDEIRNQADYYDALGFYKQLGLM